VPALGGRGCCLHAGWAAARDFPPSRSLPTGQTVESD
jgi:hypothetical protein